MKKKVTKKTTKKAAAKKVKIPPRQRIFSSFLAVMKRSAKLPKEERIELKKTMLPIVRGLSKTTDAEKQRERELRRLTKQISRLQRKLKK